MIRMNIIASKDKNVIEFCFSKSNFWGCYIYHRISIKQIND